MPEVIDKNSAVKRLMEAVRVADARLKPFRDNRRTFLKEYVGPYYTRTGDGAGASATGPEPINMLFSLASVIVPHLVSQNPKAMVTSKNPQLGPTARMFGEAWNALAKEIDLWRALRSCIFDALFGMGIMKVGLSPGGELMEMEEGYLHDNGQVYADAVDLDDYVIDAAAKSREAASFEGNRYRVPLEWALESELYDPDILRKLPIHYSDNTSRERGAAELSRGAANLQEAAEYSEHVELLDLWRPLEGDIVTIPGSPDIVVPDFIAQFEYNGPERGPFVDLNFFPVPHNVMGVSTVAEVYDLHVMINKLARKAGRQADRQKELVLFDEVVTEEAERVRDASDGEMVGVGSVSRYAQVSFGGASEDTYKQLGFLFEQFSRIAGNIDLIGGLQAESKTLGQDQMLYQGASGRLEDMRTLAHTFMKSVGERMAWYLWYDPLADQPITVQGAGGVQIPAQWNEDEKEGEFLELNFDIEPYSMQRDDPTSKFERVMTWITGVVLPTAQIGAMQGAILDVPKLVEMTGKMLNLPEASEIYMPGPPMGMGMDAVQPPGGSNTTNVSSGRGGGSRPEPSNTQSSKPAQGPGQ